jgi:hypothetical protein
MAEAAEATATEQTAQTQEGGEEQKAPDVTAQVAELKKLVEKRLPDPAQTEEVPADFFEQIMGEFEDDPNFTEQPQDFQQDAPVGTEGEQDDLANQLTAYIDEQAGRVADERVQEYVASQNEQQRAEGIRALGEKYAELRDPKALGPVLDQLEQLADSYGMDELVFDPRLIENTFLAQQGRKALEGETPAEAAAQRGASLETGAGPSDQGGSADDDYWKSVSDSGASGSVFGT